MSLILTWSENCVLTSKSTRDANYENNHMVYRVDGIVNAKLVTTGARLNVSVVTLSNKDDDKILDQFKTEFKRNIKSKKYRSEMTKQTKTNNFNYLIGPTFNNLKRLFVLLFGNEDDRKSFSKYYTPKFERKDFNLLIDGVDKVSLIDKDFLV